MGKLFELFRKPRSDESALKKRLREVPNPYLPVDTMKREAKTGEDIKIEPNIITEEDLQETQFPEEYELAVECRPIITKEESLTDKERNRLLEFKEALLERMEEIRQYKEHTIDKFLIENLEKTIVLINKKLGI